MSHMKRTLAEIMDSCRVLAIVCSQWGDTGKGKLVDFFAQWAAIIARGTGGANAGHTICLGDKEYVFHLVPSGILHSNKVNIIGNGVALDPRTLLDELGILTAAGITYQNLRIALNAKLVLPQHLVMDRIRESGAGKIGTTGRGIGPAYEDHYRRLGLTVNDLLNPDAFASKFKANLCEKVQVLETYNQWSLMQILEHPHLKGFVSDGTLDVNLIIEQYLAYGKQLKNMIDDTDALLRGQMHDPKIKMLLEGAQGNMLSIDYGTYPFVTASDCTVQGLAKGVGLTAADVDQTISIVKAFYMTRVGDGPVPTEMGGAKSAEWCATKGVNRNLEKDRFPSVSIADIESLATSKHDSENELKLGIAIRKLGKEYGATTGRPRRVGWLDLPLLRYSSQIAGKHGKNIALTKIDVLNQCPLIRVCTASMR